MMLTLQARNNTSADANVISFEIFRLQNLDGALTEAEVGFFFPALWEVIGWASKPIFT